MHRLYISDGIVLAKRARGEANVALAILTREFGLLHVAARSTRVEKSKLRYGLELLTNARFTLVRGRHEWRLVGVEHASRELLSPYAPRRIASGRVIKLLLRLVHGEEEGKELYTTLYTGLAALAATVETSEAEAIECMLVLRLLSHLGYLPHTPELMPFVEGDLFSQELAGKAAHLRTFLIRTINESLSASGL